MTKMAITVMKDPQGYIKRDEIGKLFLIENAGSLRNICLLRVAYFCGRRVSEVINVCAKDILFDECKIIFPILKKGGQLRRMKDVDKNTLLLLKEYIESNNIRPNSKIFPITRVQAWNIIRETSKNAGIRTANGKKPGMHTLRHSFAVHFMKGGGDLRTLQMLLEHSNFSTTAGYLQYSKAEITDKYNMIFQ